MACSTFFLQSESETWKLSQKQQVLLHVIHLYSGIFYYKERYNLCTFISFSYSPFLSQFCLDFLKATLGEILVHAPIFCLTCKINVSFDLWQVIKLKCFSIWIVCESQLLLGRAETGSHGYFIQLLCGRKSSVSEILERPYGCFGWGPEHGSDSKQPSW